MNAKKLIFVLKNQFAVNYLKNFFAFDGEEKISMRIS